MPDTFRRVLLEYSDEVRRFAPLPRTVYLVVDLMARIVFEEKIYENNCAKRSFRPWVPDNLMSVRSFVFRTENN